MRLNSDVADERKATPPPPPKSINVPSMIAVDPHRTHSIIFTSFGCYIRTSGTQTEEDLSYKKLRGRCFDAEPAEFGF